MNKTRLRIGKIPYINIKPIFHMLENEIAPDKYEFVTGYPSELNRMLKHGELDIGPSSSIEYLRDRAIYDYIKGHSISARGPVKSILLISRVPIESLDGQEIFMTHQSETSVALLKIILEKFYCYNCSYSITDAPVGDALQKHSAYLSIGDEALASVQEANSVEASAIEAHLIETGGKSTLIETGEKGKHYRVCTINQQAFYVYDLSELWYARTGLPFVFALWTLKKELAKNNPEAVAEFTRDLDAARDLAMKRLPEISQLPGLALSPKEALMYWEGMIFTLPDECLRGLELFSSNLLP
ncbi:menaquinone biosynthesis protein [Nitrospirota bacterium]